MHNAAKGTFGIESDGGNMPAVAHRKFNQLQDEYAETPKRMHKAKTVKEEMALLEDFRAF